ncbi:MAG: carboxypeptidase regulatory-like domain-containing protein [Verrucomicrobiales bacterium]|nr:carboxypeptidase regulatory-like domain-containing protein [Verrucomicrobiales bacterium]
MRIPRCELIGLIASLTFGHLSQAQVTETDGDWAAKTVSLANTSEAALVVRVGDVDNLGFGWPEGFDPFSGSTTPGHAFPWTVDPEDPDGTDRIMVLTSYVGTPPWGQDGYTGTTARPANSVRPIVLEYGPPVFPVHDAAFQMFVDDFQAPYWGAHYEVTLNQKPFDEIEPTINELVQTGPVGKLITVPVPSRFLPDVQSGRLEFVFDDLTTGAGDGYAIDFIKLLVNVEGLQQSGTVTGRVLMAGTDVPIANATVQAFDRVVTTGADGSYELTEVPAGLAYVTAQAPGFSVKGRHVDVLGGQTTSGVDFRLDRGEFVLSIYPAVELEFFGHSGVSYVIQYSGDLETWQDDETIQGQGELISVLRRARPETQRYWRAREL